MMDENDGGGGPCDGNNGPPVGDTEGANDEMEENDPLAGVVDENNKAAVVHDPSVESEEDALAEPQDEQLDPLAEVEGEPNAEFENNGELQAEIENNLAEEEPEQAPEPIRRRPRRERRPTDFHNPS